MVFNCLVITFAFGFAPPWRTIPSLVGLYTNLIIFSQIVYWIDFKFKFNWKKKMIQIDAQNIKNYVHSSPSSSMTKMLKKHFLVPFRANSNSKSILAWRKNNSLYSIQSTFQIDIYFWHARKTPFHSIQSKFKTKLQIKLVDPINVHPWSSSDGNIVTRICLITCVSFTPGTPFPGLSLSLVRARPLALQALRARQLLLHAGMLWRRSAALVSLITWLIVAIMVHAYPFLLSFSFP